MTYSSESGTAQSTTPAGLWPRRWFATAAGLLAVAWVGILALAWGANFTRLGLPVADREFACRTADGETGIFRVEASGALRWSPRRYGDYRLHPEAMDAARMNCDPRAQDPAAVAALANRVYTPIELRVDGGRGELTVHGRAGGSWHTAWELRDGRPVPTEGWYTLRGPIGLLPPFAWLVVTIAPTVLVIRQARRRRGGAAA